MGYDGWEWCRVIGCKCLDVKERERAPGFAEHGASREERCGGGVGEVSDDMASNGGRPWFSEDGEGLSPFEGGGAEVEEEELVGVVVDDGAAEGDEAGVFWR